MLAIICVATIDNLPYLRHKRIISRSTIGTISALVSTAISPRAAITPSAAFTISFSVSGSIAAFVSIFAIICAVEPWLTKICRKLLTSSALWIKLNATKSISLSAPNSMSAISFGVIISPPKSVSGRFKPLRLIKKPSLSIRTLIAVSLTRSTMCPRILPSNK